MGGTLTALENKLRVKSNPIDVCCHAERSICQACTKKCTESLLLEKNMISFLRISSQGVIR